MTLSYKIKPLLFGASFLGGAIGMSYCAGLRYLVQSQFNVVASEDHEYVDKEGFKL